MGKLVKTISKSEFVTSILDGGDNSFTIMGVRILLDHILEEVAKSDEDTEFDRDDILNTYSEGKLSDVLDEFGLEHLDDLREACGFAETYKSDVYGWDMVVYNIEYFKTQKGHNDAN